VLEDEIKEKNIFLIKAKAKAKKYYLVGTKWLEWNQNVLGGIPEQAEILNKMKSIMVCYVS
jgi:hypothetical protein